MATIDDTVGKLARVYDSATDEWVPLIGSPAPHTHDAFEGVQVDITEPLINDQILQFSSSASAFINTDSPTLDDLDINSLIVESASASVLNIIQPNITTKPLIIKSTAPETGSVTNAVASSGSVIYLLNFSEPETFTVLNSGTGYYVVDGVQNPTFNLVRGNTYTFVIDASGHPFWIQTVSGAYSSGNVYSDGTTNLGTDSGTITWTIPSNAPNTLYYACQYHSSMQGTINITDPAVNSSTVFTAGDLVTISGITPETLNDVRATVGSVSGGSVVIFSGKQGTYTSGGTATRIHANLLEVQNSSGTATSTIRSDGSMTGEFLGGLVHIETQTFSAVSGVNFSNDVFTSTYDNYKVICLWSTSASVTTGFRLRTAGSDNSTANYARQQIEGTGTSVLAARPTGGTSFIFTGSGSFQYVIMDILRPKIAEKTLISYLGSSQADTTSLAIRNVSGVFNATTVFDSLSLIVASGTTTGQMSLFGYAKA